MKSLAPKGAERFFWGPTLIAATVAATLGLWLLLLGINGDWYEDRFKYVAKVGSMTATILMCWAFILATRFKFVNRLFGGLDKAYKVHRFIGISAFCVVFLHPIFLAAHLLPDLSAFLGFFWFSENWANNSGIFVLAAFSVLVLLSVWNPLKYHRWKQTHNFFGIVLIGVVVHGVLGQGEIMAYPILTAWFGFWIALGLICFAYIRFLYRWFGPIYAYRVKGINQIDDVTEIFLTPENKRHSMKYKAAQFLYISFDSKALSAEPHPFTISSSPESDSLRISVKELGDWTRKLTMVEPGERARIWGPYGMFGDGVREHPERRLIMIAGGIGVTPFLSILQSKPFMESRSANTTLVYSVEKSGECVYRDELENLDLDPEKFTLRMHYSDEEGFIDLEYLRMHSDDLADCCFMICGPEPMMESITEILDDAGVPPEQVFLEDFALI